MTLKDDHIESLQKQIKILREESAVVTSALIGVYMGINANDVHKHSKAIQIAWREGQKAHIKKDGSRGSCIGKNKP